LFVAGSSQSRSVEESANECDEYCTQVRRRSINKR
jgi:hypothetical protein